MVGFSEKLGFKKILIVLFLLGIILIVGNRLRSFSYASVPFPGEVADEYSFGWLGLSLIQFRYPIAWSGGLAYPKHDFQRINVDGIYNVHPERPLFSIDKPWFDHPPLFGLVTGGYAFLSGVRQFKDASVIILRRPMLKIGILTTVLIFVLATALFGKTVGFLSAILYSVVPTTVISSRLALAENGYIPLFLGALILSYAYFSKWKLLGIRNKNIYWISAVVLGSVALLFKLSGVAVLLTLFGLALAYGGREKGKLIKWVFFGGMASFLLFFLYGAFFDIDIFLKVLLTNSQRFYGSGAEIFLQLINQSRITGKFLTDAWVLVGWISLFILSFREWRKDKNIGFIIISVFCYLIVFIIFGSESYGWYRFPFLPFLIIAESKIFIDLYRKLNLFAFLGLSLLPFGSSVHRLIGLIEFQKYVLPFRISIILLAAIFFFSLFKENERIRFMQRFFMIIVFAFLVYLSIKEVYFYGISNWYFAT